MLFIERIEGESIMIGNTIEIKIESLKHNKVYVGIHAPRELIIYRKENDALIKAQQGDQPPQKGE